MNADQRIAFIYHPLPDFLGFGGFLQRGMAQLCQAEHFKPGEEQPGFDQYYYIDDGPTYYMEPRYRPATYFAIDMVVKPYWYLEPVARYFERLQNFDRAFVSSTATLHYCQERDYPAHLLGFAADPDYHRPHDVRREYDWIACWHNCEGRIEATNRALERYPNGGWLWRGNELYAETISRARCTLNWLRGNIVNMRVFEAMAIGTPLITTRHEDMSYFDFVEGEHYLGFDDGDIEEMLEAIGWVQKHVAQALEMAGRARAFVLENHTYRHRALEAVNG